MIREVVLRLQSLTPVQVAMIKLLDTDKSSQVSYSKRICLDSPDKIISYVKVPARANLSPVLEQRSQPLVEASLSELESLRIETA